MYFLLSALCWPVLLCLQAMAEICANGYRDALRFLQENSKKLQD